MDPSIPVAVVCSVPYSFNDGGTDYFGHTSQIYWAYESTSATSPELYPHETNYWSDLGFVSTAFFADECADGTLMGDPGFPSYIYNLDAGSSPYNIDVGSTVMLGGILAFMIAYWFIGLVRGRLWNT